VAEQVATGTIQGTAGDGVGHGIEVFEHPTHHGRRSSWIAIAIIVVGFVVGGIALPIGPTWWLFWIGTGIVVIGGILALSTRIMDDWY
jgi:hypothetical protein